MTQSQSSKDTSAATTRSRLSSWLHQPHPSTGQGCCQLKHLPLGQRLGPCLWCKDVWERKHLALLSPIVRSGLCLIMWESTPPTWERGSDSSVQKEWWVSTLHYKQTPLKAKTQCRLLEYTQNTLSEYICLSSLSNLCNFILEPGNVPTSWLFKVHIISSKNFKYGLS